MAGLTLTAAVLTKDEHLLSIFLVGLTLMILLGTIAHRLPVLHRLPHPLGAMPPPAVVLHLEGHDTMTSRLQSDGPAEVVLSVGFKNDQRDEVSKVTLNVWVEGATRIARCTQDGSPYQDGGQMMRSTDWPFWSVSGVEINPDAFIVFFSVELPGAGSYRTVVSFRSPQFYEKKDQVHEDRLILITPGLGGSSAGGP